MLSVHRQPHLIDAVAHSVLTCMMMMRLSPRASHGATSTVPDALRWHIGERQPH